MESKAYIGHTIPLQGRFEILVVILTVKQNAGTRVYVTSFCCAQNYYTAGTSDYTAESSVMVFQCIAASLE